MLVRGASQCTLSDAGSFTSGSTLRFLGAARRPAFGRAAASARHEPAFEVTHTEDEWRSSSRLPSLQCLRQGTT